MNEATTTTTKEFDPLKNKRELVAFIEKELKNGLKNIDTGHSPFWDGGDKKIGEALNKFFDGECDFDDTIEVEFVHKRKWEERKFEFKLVFVNFVDENDEWHDEFEFEFPEWALSHLKNILLELAAAF